MAEIIAGHKDNRAFVNGTYSADRRGGKGAESIKESGRFVLFLINLCRPSRPARPAQREAHREAPGDGPSLSGAAAEAQPPGLLAAVRQAAPENDRPAPDRHRPRALHPAAEQDGGGHVLAPAAAGDHEGLVLNVPPEAGRRRKRTRAEQGQKRQTGKESAVGGCCFFTLLKP